MSWEDIENGFPVALKKEEQMRVIDMHAHLSCLSGEGVSTSFRVRETAEIELAIRKENNILTCFSSGTPDEWQFMRQFRHRKELSLSFGIHPWYAERYEVEDCRDFFAECDVIGEIGMDSVWCNTDQKIQRKRFEQQLGIAADLKKPVILHTKGQEELIADIIKGFPQKVCVHWYSGDERNFEKFLDAGCYFTLGPDTAQNCREAERENHKLCRRMIREIPVNRMFVETDGISAVAWARGEETAGLEEIPAVLKENMEYVSRERGLALRQLAGILQQNFLKFK